MAPSDRTLWLMHCMTMSQRPSALACKTWASHLSNTVLLMSLSTSTLHAMFNLQSSAADT